MSDDLSKGAIQAGQAIDIARRLESALETLGAQGKGLHEKVGSVEDRLPAALVSKLRYIASVRNKIVHEDEVLPDAELAAFTKSGKQAADALAALQAGPRPAQARSPAKPRKPAKRRAAAAPAAPTPARTASPLPLFIMLLLAGVTLVFLLVLLGNDGISLGIGAFATFFALGAYFLRRLGRLSTDPAPR